MATTGLALLWGRGRQEAVWPLRVLCGQAAFQPLDLYFEGTLIVILKLAGPSESV